MRRVNLDKLVLGLCASAIVGCTFMTDSNERKVVDAIDFNLTMQTVSVSHGGTQMDIAVVQPRDPGAPIPSDTALDTADPMGRPYSIRARARVLIPLPAADGSQKDVKVTIKRLLEKDEQLQVLFYADTRSNNLDEPLCNAGLAAQSLCAGQDRFEHSWIRAIPDNGEVTFLHQAKFQNFYEDQIEGVGGDIVLQVPPGLDLPAGAARLACLNRELQALMKDSLEVRVIQNPDPSGSRNGYALFKMFANNTLPVQDVRFLGLADSGSKFGVESVIDDRILSATLSAAAGVNGLTIPFDQWLLPFSPTAIAACLAM